MTHDYIKASFFATLFIFSFCLFQDKAEATQHLNNIAFQKVQLANTPSQSVRTIYQDTKGYLWVGTYEGLVRYDGHSSRVYVHNPLDNHSIANSQIAAIIEGPNNKLWVASADGSINIFDYQNEQFTRIQNHSTINEDRFIRCIFKDSNNQMWFGTDGGIFTVNPNTYEVSHYTSQNTTIYGVWDITQGPKGGIWAATLFGLMKLDPKSHQFELYQYSNPALGIQATQLNNVEFAGENLWLGSFKQGAFLLDTTTAKINQFLHDSYQANTIQGNLIRHIFKDRNSNIWIAGHGGMSLWQEETKDFIRLDAFKNRPASEKNIEPMVLYQDRAGIIWMGSANGLYKWSPSTSAFHSLSDEINKHLSNNNVYAIHSTKSHIWVGTLDGVFQINPKTQQTTHYSQPTDHQNANSNNRVTALYSPSEHELWLGSLAGGLSYINTQKGIYQNLQASFSIPKPLANSTITAILPYENNKLWIATYGHGLYLFDPIQQTATLEYQTTPEANQLSTNRINTLMTATDGKLWVSHHGGGISIIGRANHTSTLLAHNPKDQQSISSNDVELVFEDSQGNIWVGTLDGLNLLTNKNIQNNQFTFQRFSIKDGLPSNVIFGILEDQSGQIWLSTNNGLSKYDPSTNTFTNYNMSDGLISNTFNSFAYHKDQNNRLYFGSVQGVIAFDPAQVTINTQPPAIELSGILIRNKFKSYQAATQGTDAIQLTHKDYLVAFEFAALDFTAPEQNQYLYKLAGFDTEWIAPGNLRRATYTNLPAGKYQFKVKASNNDGIWNEQGLTIPVIVSPPIWLTWWAYCLYAMLTLAILYRVYTYRAKKLIQNNQKLEQAVAKRTAELDASHQEIAQLLEQKKSLFANVSHELRTPISLIIGPLESILAKLKGSGLQKQVDLINRNAKRLAQLVDQILDLAKLDNAKHIPLKIYPIQTSLTVISESFLTVAKLREQNLIVKITCQGTVKLLDDSLEQILSNLISNAIKYTAKGGEISVTAKSQNNKLKIHVKDNGPGISPDKQSKVFERFLRLEGNEDIQGSGIGLALVKELVEANHGTIQLVSVLGQGSEFIISFPMHQGDESTIPATVLTNSQHLDPTLYVELADNIEPKNANNDDNKPSLLIVEDNADMRTFIVDSLAPTYQCLTAKNGKEGLKLATEYLPDVIISDLMMPEMTGLDLIKNIREHELTAHIPFVLLTAKGDDASRIQGWKLDVDDYVAKPFNAVELEARLARLLSIRQILSKRQGRMVTDSISQENLQSFESLRDQKFFEKFQQTIIQQYSQADLTRAQVANALTLSERQLSRKLSALIDTSFSDYLREYRLSQAKIKLAKGEQITQVSFEVGFSSQSYFSRCFKAEFGITPKQFVEGMQTN